MTKTKTVIVQTQTLPDADISETAATTSTASADNADSADNCSPTVAIQPTPTPPNAPSPPPPNHVDDMVQELQQVELFHDEQQKPYASVDMHGHREHLEIESKAFGHYVNARAHKRWKRTLNKNQYEELVNIVSGKAIHEGQMHPVHLRVAPGSEAFYIDIGDKDRRTVEVTAQGWQLTQTPPVRFRRPASMGSLPVPVRGGRIDDLKPFLNCGDEGFKMIVGFVLASFRTAGPYPILELVGEKGTSKSTTTRLVQALVDPSQTQLGSPVRTEEQLAVRAEHAWLVALDNCSGMTDEMSDVLCRLSTGGSYSARQLYTNTSQVVMNYCRPSVINGIENVGRRSDLLDRCWGLELTRIPSHQRKTETALWADFNLVSPRIFGAICDALVVAVRDEQKVQIPLVDRLADAERWVTAAEPAMGWSNGAFQTVLRNRRSDVVHRALDEYPGIWEAMKGLAAKSWSGTVSELQAEVGCSSMKPSQFGGLMRRLTPDLAAVGIEVKKWRQGHGSMRGYSVKSVVGTVGTVGMGEEANQ